MLAKQIKIIKDAPTKLCSQVHDVLAEDNHKCEHNIIASTGEFCKNHEKELDNVHCSTRQLKGAMRKNDHVLGVATKGPKKPTTKCYLSTFQGCQHTISIF